MTPHQPLLFLRGPAGSTISSVFLQNIPLI